MKHLKWFLVLSLLGCSSVVFAQAAQKAPPPPAAPAAPAATDPAPMDPAPVEPMPDDSMVTTEASPMGAPPQSSMVGKLGVGYFSTAAPVGIRKWVNDQMGFDVGVGFNYDKRPPADAAWGMTAEGGLLYALAHLENIIVFARGGLGIGLSDSGNPGSGTDLNMYLNGMIGGEFFMTGLGFPNLSFTGGIGLQLDLNKPDGQDMAFKISTASAQVDITTAATLGFHIYF